MALAVPRSSGDLIADRRYAYAIDMAAEGLHAEAADVIEQALELAPGWPEGWLGLAETRERAGDRAGAIAAFGRARDLDPTDRLGAALHLARLGVGSAPDAPPAAYVRDLFDAYAGGFETALVDRLGYQAPRLIATALAAAAPERRFRHGLDLGCGTGLMAAALAGRTERLDGVDLSPAMVAQARAKGLYANLRVGEIVADLAGPVGPYDLVLAADVFCYLGDLAPVLRAARGRVDGGALLAFSVERGDAGFALGDSLRYRHAADYVAATLAATGWGGLAITDATLRVDRGEPVPGLVVTAKVD